MLIFTTGIKLIVSLYGKHFDVTSLLHNLCGIPICV